MKLSILGATYTLSRREKAKDPRLANVSGYCDQTSRLLVVEKEPAREVDMVDDLVFITNNTVRHEIVHAFFFESGMNGRTMKA